MAVTLLNTHLPFTLNNISFSLSVVSKRLVDRLCDNTHVSSAPYLSGDTFLRLADHVYTPESPFNPAHIQENDTVFVALPLLPEFFSQVHPHIDQQYILVCHNGDQSFGDSEAKLIDKKIRFVLTQNATTSNKKVVPIPIGLENRDYHNHGEPAVFNSLLSKKSLKKNRILFGFSITTNIQERHPLYKMAKKLPLAEEVPSRLNTLEYLELLNQYQFVLSPPGNGEDCHRTWEALYLGVIPIVKSTPMMRTFQRLGLPLWLVKDWKELNNYTEKDLKTKYRKLWAKANTTSLFLPYWKQKLYALKAS